MGVIFLDCIVVLETLQFTTHWMSLEILHQASEVMSKHTGTKPTRVVGAHWVDAGPKEHGVKLITAGGISCGLDSTVSLV